MSDETIIDLLVRELFSTDPRGWIVKLAAAVIAIYISVWTSKLVRWMWPQLKTIVGSVHRLQRALNAVALDGKGVWLARSIPIEPPSSYNHNMSKSIPIIVVANLKGGVGKTTTVANLVAHYALKKKEKVLALDFDFQGSLSSTALNQVDYDELLEAQSTGSLSKAAHLLDNGSSFYLLNACQSIQDLPGAQLMPTYYSLASIENKVLVEWLVGERRQDMRYDLARVLLDPQVQSQFDRIIIDAPPRLTTACIQALCASTHVLVPTVLDDLSAEAVASFCDQLRIHESLWPNLKLLGMVGVMTERIQIANGQEVDGALTEYEATALKKAMDSMDFVLQSAGPNLKFGKPLPRTCFIPEKAELSRSAGRRIAYAAPQNSPQLQQIRAAFDELGDKIDRIVSNKSAR